MPHSYGPAYFGGEPFVNSWAIPIIFGVSADICGHHRLQCALIAEAIGPVACCIHSRPDRPSRDAQ